MEIVIESQELFLCQVAFDRAFVVSQVDGITVVLKVEIFQAGKVFALCFTWNDDALIGFADEYFDFVVAA